MSTHRRPIMARPEIAARAAANLQVGAVHPGADTGVRVSLNSINTEVTWNPRGLVSGEAYAEEHLAPLIGSIRKVGVLQPLLVRPAPDQPGTYQLVAGFRRFHSARLAGLTEVPVLIRDLTDEEAADASIVENTQRQALHDVDETFSVFARMSAATGLSPFDVGRALKKILNGGGDPHGLEDLLTELSPFKLAAWANRRVKVLYMTEQELAAVRERRVSLFVAEALTRLRDRPERAALLVDAERDNLTAGDVNARVNALLNMTAPKDDSGDLVKRLRATVTPKALKSLDEGKRQRAAQLLLDLEALFESPKS